MSLFTKRYRLIMVAGRNILTLGGSALPEAEASADDLEGEYRYRYRGTDYLARVATELEGEGLQAVGLRESYATLSEADYLAAQKGMELMYWDAASHHCGRCGGVMHRSGPISKRCAECGAEVFPQVSPAVIVLVERGDEALLVHARTFSRPFYGLVAGFVETGESLEECVAREVAEETSLLIDDIRYFGSQAWGYPSQIMIGFTARYAGGELRFADGELTSGGFFRADSLPLLPGAPSIARRMIDAWISRSRPGRQATCSPGEGLPAQ